MGWFSGKYKYYAFAGSSVLIPPEEREHTVKSLMLQAAMAHEDSLGNVVNLGLQIDMHRRAHKMAKYAAKPDGYPYGFPEVSNTYYALPWADLQPFVEAEVGHPVENSAYYLEAPTNFRWMWVEAGITDNYLSWFSGTPPATNWYYFPDEIEIPVVNPDTGDYYLADNQSYGLTVVGDIATVTFHYTDKDGAAQSWVAPSFALGYPDSGTWIMLRWRNPADLTEFGYYFYEVNSGVNPDLELAIEKQEFLSSYLPIAVLMHDRVWFDEQENPVLEEGLDKLLKYLAMDPWDLKEGFIDSIENPDPEDADEVPPIEDVWDFFIQFSMPLRTNDNAGREYLFHFYRYLKSRTWTTFEDYNEWVVPGVGTQPMSLMSVEEGEEYTGYIARYAWSYIEERTFTGSFTPPGWDRPLKTRELWSDEFELGDFDYNYGLDLIHGAGNYNVAVWQVDGTEHTYTMMVRQNPLSESVDGATPTYTIILMMGPSMEYQINTSDTSLGVGEGDYEDFRYRFVDVEIFPEDPELDSEFRWPIHIASLHEVSSMRREPALMEALCATVFLVHVEYVAWYQRKAFAWILIIIIVVIIILTWQYELLGTIQGLIATATAAGATGTAIAWTILYLAYTFAIGFMIAYAGALIGGTWGKIFVIVATIMMMYASGGTLNVQANWTQMTSNFGWATAGNFLQSIKPFIDITELIIEDRALAKLDSEMRDFTLTAREKYEELENAWAEFGDPPDHINPLDLVRSFEMRNWAEKPSTYYDRTLNANPGILGYDMINRFADLALLPPEAGQPVNFVEAIFRDMEEQRGAV
jgi:hypothetical protein